MILKNQIFRVKYIGSLRAFNLEGVENGEEDPNNKKTSNFRLAAKKLFLTYSRTNIKPTEVLIQLQNLFKDNIEEYLIVQETNKNNDENNSSDKHTYVYLQLKKLVNITNPKKLGLVDIKTQNVIHGVYKSVKNKSLLIDSLKKKNKDYLCERNESVVLKLKEMGYQAETEFSETNSLKTFKKNFLLISPDLKKYFEERKQILCSIEKKFIEFQTLLDIELKT